ncbi:hypothetical protein T459_18513 [Capsicum annuum]|uniref:Reverse transcriptase domain-containing protein n=1 Tax=Capsicum annuum TaxID=4072 RepID=A0A2G2ZEX5_CAPAN|nr:hypothetical protein T459_18513 [Capsicum annuum]
MAAPGGPRPRNAPPPNYNPNALADGMQNLQVNRPNQPPGAPRHNTPFGQQPPFAGGPPVSRPGPPPPGVFPRGPASPSGPPQTGLSPPVAQSVPTFASRPPPPGVMPPSMGGAPPPPGSLPSGLGSRPGSPGPFSSSPLTTGPAVPPPSSISSSVSNGPPSGGPGMMQGGTRFPPPSNAMRPPFGAPPPAMVSPGASSQPSGMRSPFGSSSSVSTTPVTAQPPPPFSGSFQNVPPPPGSSPFAAPSQAMPPPMGAPHMGAPYGTQSWQLPPHQGAPSSAIPGSMQPPSMYGMAPPLPNQAVASITSSIGHSSPSKVDPNQIPRPIPNASVVLHETRQGYQANPPPPATSDYIVRDTGNCSPRYMRCTINQIPCTVDLLTTSAMQLALLVQPLALPHPSEEPLQAKNGSVKPLTEHAKQIIDAVLIANEAIDSRMSQSKLGILCKLDIEKAYDHVNWDFILRQMGFGERWIGWINFCMSTVKFFVLINGSPGGFFNAHRGIRQGDPLFPFLFIIAMEGLNNMLNIAKEAGRIQGFEVSKVAGNSVEITHLQYVDDTLIFCGVEEEQLMILRLILVYFEAISGLHINWNKSHLYPINVVPEMDYLSRILGGVVGNLPSVYLGMPLGAKSRTQFWRKETSYGKAIRKGKAFTLSSGRISLEAKKQGGLGIKNLKNQSKALKVKWLWRCSLCGKDMETVRPFPALQIHCPALADFPKSQRHFLVVDFGESGPVRCSRCKGYINPFMKFIDQGRHGPKYDCKNHGPDSFDEFVNSPRNPAKICFFDSTWHHPMKSKNREESCKVVHWFVVASVGEDDAFLSEILLS